MSGKTKDQNSVAFKKSDVKSTAVEYTKRQLIKEKELNRKPIDLTVLDNIAPDSSFILE